MISKVNHIAIVTSSLEEATTFWSEALGLPLAHTHREEAEGVDVAFLPVGESQIELLAPFDETTGVAKFLAKRGAGFHHLCVEVTDIEESLARLKEHAVPLIDETPRTNSSGRRMAFVHPKGTGGVLVELYEAEGKNS